MHDLKELDFTVREVPCFAEVKEEEFHMVDRKAIVRDDTDDVLGVVGERYQVVPHMDGIEAVIVIMKEIDPDYDENHHIIRGGSKIVSRFTCPNLKARIENPVLRRDDLLPSLSVWHTYDGSKSQVFSIGAYRLVCSNGLMVGTTHSFQKHRHTPGLDYDAMLKRAREAMDSFTGRLMPLWNKMAGIDLSRKDGVDIIKDMKKKDLMGKSDGELILAQWRNQRHMKKAEGGRTLWSLYNVFTSVLTDRLQEHRPERFEQLSAPIGNYFLRRAA